MIQNNRRGWWKIQILIPIPQISCAYLKSIHKICSGKEFYINDNVGFICQPIYFAGYKSKRPYFIFTLSILIILPTISTRTRSALIYDSRIMEKSLLSNFTLNKFTSIARRRKSTFEFQIRVTVNWF